MAAARSQNLLPTVLADMLRWGGSSAGQGAILGVPSSVAWPLAMRSTSLAPGDRVVMTRAGEDSARWAALAGDLGYDVVCIDVPPGEGPSLEELTHLLWWDASVKAVFVARDETSTGMTADVGEVRRVMDLTGSDALLLVECSASWGLDGVQQCAWSADLVVTALGTPVDDTDAATLLGWSERLPGLAALAERAGPPPHDLVLRLRSQLDDVDEGVSPGATRRLLGEGLRRGLAAAGLDRLATHHPSEAVTVVHLPPSVQAAPLGQMVAANGRTPTDLGEGALAGRVLRIWHSGLRNEVDVLTVVATVEVALLVAGGPETPQRGLQSARAWFETRRADAA